MSKITTLIEAELKDNEALGLLAYHAIPDLQRLVEWVRGAYHQPGCKLAYLSGKTTEKPGLIELNPCTCGWTEIQSLIGE